MKAKLKIFNVVAVGFLTIQFMSCAMYKAHKKDPKAVGEIVPLSARVAKIITQPIRKEDSPKKMMEVGAGSGALTKKIITKMTENDHLDLIEIEPLLCDVLREKFGHLKNVSIQCMDFLNWHPNYQYDYIVSTLPFNSFKHDLVQKLVDHLAELAKPSAYVAFVEFKWLSGFRMLGMNKAEKEEFLKTRSAIEGFYEKHKQYTSNVYLNFPPILIYHLKINKE